MIFFLACDICVLLLYIIFRVHQELVYLYIYLLFTL